MHILRPPLIYAYKYISKEKDLPPYSTVYWHYKQWRDAVLIEQLIHHLHADVRKRIKKRQWTTLIMIDSQVVKNTCNVGVDSNGFYFYKSTNEIKRHLKVRWIVERSNAWVERCRNFG